MLKDVEECQKILKNVKRHSNFKNVTDGWMDGRTDLPTNRARCRVACTQLKTKQQKKKNRFLLTQTNKSFIE